ncbi:epithelial membrane protein 1 [Biomphalaria glabrata]|uniref:Epithelial membrane protein 1-like n=1 Tax=Biomphalaria glabrata TaxID=6526 RepID=A0A9W2ZJZ9_BIOGL|nr:epithelial membrane protein 1-like [Biomphalaria glabrata]XP_013093059.2 epithelial membrane protein 1-like [Biomphalaria glabrata]XP_055875306.1 epithelial membrane protein 1-like [Biomphalaria glabrata]XP_055875307.1 epithelial membrane protein 1-like [Biomphalaria glabrata]XP_055875308.1 epithelial membrane protein 1-like [Biomphalaria glabrata]KAI8766423.1 epithelial membrane protein 1-like [Biomphalaria glabrata]
MGVKDGFMEANLVTKLSFCIVLFAVIINWIAFCTTSWFLVSGINYYGLWRACTATTCGSMLDGSPDDDINAIQAFAIFGFMGLNVGFFLIVMYMFWGSCKGNGETGLAAAISLLVSAGCWLIAVAIFGSKYDDYSVGRFGYSFALAVIALILALVAGILMVVGGRGNSSVSSK